MRYTRWRPLLLWGISGLLSATLVQAADRALLIGIDKYTGVPPLVGSVHDVQKIRRFAQTSWGYRDDQIKVLLDEQATRNGILAARLQEHWRQDTANRQAHWSLGKLDFTILP